MPAIWSKVFYILRSLTLRYHPAPGKLCIAAWSFALLLRRVGSNKYFQGIPDEILQICYISHPLVMFTTICLRVFKMIHFCSMKCWWPCSKHGSRLCQTFSHQAHWTAASLLSPQGFSTVSLGITLCVKALVVFIFLKRKVFILLLVVTFFCIRNNLLIQRVLILWSV